MIDQTENRPALSSAQLSLMEKIGDTHVATHNHSEAMKYYFASPSTPHQKIVGAYRSFLAHMGITEYSKDYLESTQAIHRSH